LHRQVHGQFEVDGQKLQLRWSPHLRWIVDQKAQKSVDHRLGRRILWLLGLAVMENAEHSETAQMGNLGKSVQNAQMMWGILQMLQLAAMFAHGVQDLENGSF
jgi:hypothetical protein